LERDRRSRVDSLLPDPPPNPGDNPKVGGPQAFTPALGAILERGRPGLSCKISLARLGNPQRSLRISLAGPRAARPFKSL
jgi:hypothetical protein